MSVDSPQPGMIRFMAAITDVTSSGMEVPIATIVKPITRSLMPNNCAMLAAPFTSKWPPANNPIMYIDPTLLPQFPYP